MNQPAPWKQWGTDIDAEAIRQLQRAVSLPVSIKGALMPDAHVGYGLPIGGVLAVRNAVIPYAVGVDIACRMKMTVLDLPVKYLQSQEDRLTRAIETETAFGIGANFKRRPREHVVMDMDWDVSPLVRHLRDKAWEQLGTSGSGNHFVEFGVFTVKEAPEAPHVEDSPGRGDAGPGLPPGAYLALLTHSGSRGAGAQIAGHYSRLAKELHPELPKELAQLAWLDLESQEGREYWNAMQLMGEYASANHGLIHKHIAKNLGAKVLFDIENHHNFAWEEEITVEDGSKTTAIVHRKGATPAGGVMGIVPGSMASPAYLVRGKGNADSLNSCSHGAGRRMSRTKARQMYRWAHVKPLLEERGVKLISAGLDEVPMVYKDIEEVMAAQSDLVEVVARFDPKLVKMAPEGEQAED